MAEYINSFVHPNAKIGKNVKIEPFSYIAENVEIGDNCVIGPHATIYDYVTIGDNCKVFPGAVVGGIPQDLKFKGEVSYVKIGNNVTIRECATVHRGTEASGKGITTIDDNTLIMAYAHVAHDCKIGKNCIIVSFSGLAGETDIDDWAIIGGNTMAHQFSKVGMHAMIGGGTLIGQDVPPFAMAAGAHPILFEGINIVGLRRRGFTAEQIDNIKTIYDIIYNSNLNTTQACRKVEEEFPECNEKRIILDFIKASNRGIIRPRKKDK